MLDLTKDAGKIQIRPRINGRKNEYSSVLTLWETASHGDISRAKLTVIRKFVGRKVGGELAGTEQWQGDRRTLMDASECELPGGASLGTESLKPQMKGWTRRTMRGAESVPENKQQMRLLGQVALHRFPRRTPGLDARLLNSLYG